MKYIVSHKNRETGNNEGVANREFTVRKEAERYISRQNSNVYNMYFAYPINFNILSQENE